MFLHRLEQSALRFGGGAVDLVDQHHLRKEGAWVKNETLFISIEDGIAENVGWEQIARELDALKCEAKRTRQRLRERRLADAGNIFDQEMAAGEQTSDRQLYRAAFSDDDFANLLCESGNVFAYVERNCRITFVCEQGAHEVIPSRFYALWRSLPGQCREGRALAFHDRFYAASVG